MSAARLLVVLASALPALVAACAPAAPTLTHLDETILAPKCMGPCHSGGEFAAGGLDLKLDPYAALMKAPVITTECVGLSVTRVVPGDPSDSLLYLKIVARTDGTLPVCGEPMPLGEDYPPLSRDEVEAIAAWIEGGALDD